MPRRHDPDRCLQQGGRHARQRRRAAIDADTTVNLASITAAKEERSLLELIVGAIQSFSRKPKLLAVTTPYLNATIEGTEFLMQVTGQRSILTVYEGVVVASNDNGSARVGSGDAVAAEPGQAPKPYLVVRPRDAVQWAMYYPPILAALGGQADRIPADLPATLAEAFDRGARGTSLRRSICWIGCRRATAMHSIIFTGRRCCCRSAAWRKPGSGIDRAIAEDSGSGLAYALRTVIDVVRNEKSEALANGQRAVELSPDAAAPRIALSYAQQANFQLEAARDTLQQAVEAQPDDALAWARLSELWLALGYRDRARDAAEKAVALAPDLERAQVVLAFAALAEFRTEAAKSASERAIALDSSDPLPRLGLGLAQIREGAIEEGRRNIEVAVGLNGNDALLRAYLGKSYFHEEREPLAAEQFAIAKDLDPLDPTAFFYDAILKQAENRPVEALGELQEAIDRNDNRAVYRSRLALDQDLAARSTSLGRIYDDLGFHNLGETTASRSLTLDPSNASAHRFLSDIFRGYRRREIARVSELLQAQLLQDVNINPVQPSLSETNLNIAGFGGPADPGFNEFTSLFQHDQVQVNLSGTVGNNSTFGTEGVVSGVYDGFSISAGAFHFQTDGFRPNFDITHNIYNAFAQAAITPELSLSVELRHRDSKEGDLELNFDPDVFKNDSQRELDQESARVGLRYSPVPGSDFLLSFIYNDREDRLNETEFFDPFSLSTDIVTKDKGTQLEGQYIFQRERLNAIAGVGLSNIDRKVDQAFALDGVSVFNDRLDVQIDHPRAYAYSNINFPQPVTWTVGLALDDYEEGDLNVEEVSPKLGVQWHLDESLVLRAAWFETVKPALVNNRTIEPTQVAGFNQLFDDINGTQSSRYGIGLDWNVTNAVMLGAEATWRDMDVPISGSDGFFFEKEEEQSHRVYLNWTPLPEWAFSTEFVYVRFQAKQGQLTDLTSVPLDLQTISIPLRLRYFHPSGFFAGLQTTYVHQEVERSEASSFPDGTDSFFVVDVAAGYRLPNRAGVVSLQIQNLFDTKFKYQDDSFREFGDEPSVSPYIPALQFRAQVTLNF